MAEQPEKALCLAIALYPYRGDENDGEITFKEGDRIVVISKDESGWWLGCVEEKSEVSFCTHAARFATCRPAFCASCKRE